MKKKRKSFDESNIEIRFNREWLNDKLRFKYYAIIRGLVANNGEQILGMADTQESAILDLRERYNFEFREEQK